MSTGIISKSNEFIIPFSIPSQKRKEPFTLDLEKAAVFSFAELNRGKGGGFLSKQPQEEIAFISKLGYPLLMYGWDEHILVFDGFNKISHTLSYASLPEVRFLIDEVIRSSKTRETYLNFLKNHLPFLENSTSQKQLVLNGLLQNLDLLNDINSSRHQANKLETDSTDVTLLSPIIDESMILSEVQEIESVHFNLQQDIKDLYEYMKLLDESTRIYVKELQDITKTVKEEFDLKIKAENERIAPIITELKQNNDTKVVELIADHENQNLQIQKEIVQLEKDKHQAQEKIEECKQQIENQTENKPAVEQIMTEKINETQKEIYDIEDRLKQTENDLKNVRERQILEAFKLKDELEAKLKETMGNVKELEAARDANILIYNQEKEQLETKTKQLIDQIGKALKLREVDISQFARLGIWQESASNEKHLLYLPFYVICYEEGQKKRYYFLSPSIASAVGFFTKLKRFLHMAVSNKILIPRFKAFYLLKETIYALIYQNALFEAKIDEIGIKTNIFSTSSSKAEIKKALVCLKKEGWLADKEFSAVSQRLDDSVDLGQSLL